MATELRITTPSVLASVYNVKTTSTHKLVDLIKIVNGTSYLTGLGSKEYLEESVFHKHNIQIIWQEYTHPVYRQLYGEFIPMLSSLDYLMMQSNKGSFS
jgi:hypothetical protein